MTAPAAPWLRPVPFTRLAGVQLRIWRAHRFVAVAAVLSVAAGAGAAALGVGLPGGRLTGGVVAERFALAEALYGLFWPVIGAVGAASAFTGGWAVLVLGVAPRRGRWLLAASATFLLVAAVATAAFVALGWLAVVLAGAGADAAGAVPRRFLPVLGVTLLRAAAGFLLGAALRNVAVALVLLYVVRWALPLLVVRSVDIGVWLDLDTATAALATGDAGRHHGLPVVTALLLWIVVPAATAWARLRSSAQ
ncbi:hypothetical protein Val02_48570 [Virgisporangium aliadipatigenens]|uniref:Uncharacterized protein n=1 Tax=Virgisporangium aliadipatigenens TaxID=741659 RepID=A0A8J3YMI3_9ACTN|nr:hypothetical protein [Virgisporangium aliadipatigenens]GIJ47971.1 hypothetical protein Val02_48570 [Virgisporangium aliadipatigenens]